MPRALEYREVIKRLTAERPNVTVVKQRGKGSHRMVHDPGRSIHYPLPHHGDDKRRLQPGYLKDLIRLLGLPADIFD